MQDGKVDLSVQIVGQPVPDQPSRRQRCVGVSRGLVTHAACRLQGTCAAEQPQLLATPSNSVLPLRSHEREAVYPTRLAVFPRLCWVLSKQRKQNTERDRSHACRVQNPTASFVLRSRAFKPTIALASMHRYTSSNVGSK